MEHECNYVTIRGIKRLCTFKSKIFTSDNVNGVQYLVLMIKDKLMYNGCSIFVCSNLLTFFVRNILPHIKHTFILVSGMSIKQCPVEALSKNDFFALMENKYLIKWCSQNNSINHHKKIVQIPLGLDYHLLYNDYNKSRNFVDGNSPKQQEKYLLDIVKQMRPFYERKNKIYVNFDINADRYGQRKKSLQTIPKELMEIHLEKIRRTETWKRSAEYAFVLSPYGQGMDCHRTWEALILGCIPIIQCKEMKNLYSDLPVLNVSDWSEITEELLEKTIQEFKCKTFNYEKLTFGYWKKIVFSVCQAK
jgi:hypothetical protein